MYDYVNSETKEEMMINTFALEKYPKDAQNSSTNEIQQTEDKAGLPNFLRGNSDCFGPEAVHDYMNGTVERKINLNLDRNQISVTKLVLSESNGSDSGIERLPCGSDTYFDRSFDSDQRADYI